MTKYIIYHFSTKFNIIYDLQFFHFEMIPFRLLIKILLIFFLLSNLRRIILLFLRSYPNSLKILKKLFL